jgi:sensitive to high expression protein 9
MNLRLLINPFAEQLVKSRHAAVQEAKASVDTAHAQRAASQKEVVGLLERKHSWSAADLERYMTLIRSEHVNDQAVQAAKDAVTTAEHSLDEARTRLEKRERAQYHEEQIWSDTIRRNSTWVTFGLMGVNIAILLVNLVAVEPWRRKRLVREIRSALDEKTLPAAVESTLTSAADIKKDIDAVVEPAGIALEDIEQGLADESSPFKSPEVSESSLGQISANGSVGTLEASQPWTLNWAKAHLKALVSDQQISIRKVDVTAVALEAATAGALLAGLAVMLLKSR